MVGQLPPQVITARSALDLEPPPRASAALFDWDGTLADSTMANFQALRLALGAQGVELDETWFRARTGISAAEMAPLVAARQGRSIDVDRVIHERDASFLECMSGVREVGVVAALARRLRGRGWPLALASGGRATTLLPTVRHLGMQDLFDVIVTREDVTMGKPSPAVFLLAATRLAVPTDTCLVYEDSDEGIQAAEAAGMLVVDVRPVRDRPPE